MGVVVKKDDFTPLPGTLLDSLAFVLGTARCTLRYLVAQDIQDQSKNRLLARERGLEFFR